MQLLRAARRAAHRPHQRARSEVHGDELPGENAAGQSCGAAAGAWPSPSDAMGEDEARAAAQLSCRIDLERSLAETLARGRRGAKAAQVSR